ncbi:MAG: hypothetical protein ABIO70_33620 [Pseudomonadota bacterium]
MIRLLTPWLLLLALLLPARALADATIVLPDGDLLPGRANRLMVVLHHGGLPVTEATPTVAAEPGRVEPLEGRLGAGLYAYRYLAPPDLTGQVTFTIGTGAGGIKRIHLPVARLPRAPFRGPDHLDLLAGAQRELVFLLEGEDLPPPALVEVETSEGQVQGVELVEGGLQVKVLLGEERFPRVAVVAVRDRRYTESPPVWVPVRLIGRPRIPVRTEPGAVVDIDVGGRHYGPFKAGEDGLANASISVWPGEDVAAVRITDATGNVQHSTLNIGREERPLLLLTGGQEYLPGTRAPPVFLAAFDARGLPWDGPDPRCGVAPEGGGEVVKHAPGRYVIVPTPPERGRFLDLRLECTLPGTLVATRVRLPMGEGIPDHLQLRVYPSALSADFPVAQLQVLLEDRTGERVQPVGVEVSAQRGEVHLEMMEGGALRGEYNGALASPQGSDRIIARYDRPLGDGPVARLRVGHGAPGLAQGAVGLPVYGRALDGQGKPLAGVELELRAGEAMASALTGDRGWAQAVLPIAIPGELTVLECRCRSLVARAPFFPGSPGDLTDLRNPDLEQSVEIPISAGRVREVFIDTSPAVLYAGPSAVARVRVRLVDRQGNAVTDESIRVIADVGEVGPLRATADATYEAWYRPPPELRSGTVQISAIGQQGAAVGSTRIQLSPRPLSWALGLSGGVLSNFGAVTSPLASVTAEGRPFPRTAWVLARTSLCFYEDRKSILDDATGETIRVTTRFLPIVIGGSVRLERGLDALSFGAGVVGLVYHTDLRFADQPSAGGAGFGGPGAQLHVEYGRRVGIIGELTAGVRYLLVTTRRGPLSYGGPVGGLAATGGYRVLF